VSSRKGRGPTTEQQLQAAKSLVRREVLRQVIAPLRVLATRMVLYYVPRTKGFTRPWISVRNGVASLRESNAIVGEEIDNVLWYHLPRVKRDKLDEARQRNVPVYTAWIKSLGRGGAHAEELWRAAFRSDAACRPRPHRAGGSVTTTDGSWSRSRCTDRYMSGASPGATRC
jgi:hypothetical protein